jgi:hypothetical protein
VVEAEVTEADPEDMVTAGGEVLAAVAAIPTAMVVAASAEVALGVG